jgi:hypothetical protein
VIITHADGWLQVVLQTDHAALAGQFAAVWGAPPFRPADPFDPVVWAAEAHDDGWYEWEAAPRIQPETGLPFQFIYMPVADHIAIYERGVQLALDRHPYTGLLVSLHGAGLYRERYGFMPHLVFRKVDPADRPQVDRYLADQDRIQQRLLSRLNPDRTVLWTHYRWLQCWDLLSLYLCMKSPAEAGTYSLGRMPQYPGGPEVELLLSGDGGQAFVLDPWPFQVAELALEVPVRLVPDRPYSGDQEFRACFAAAAMRRQTVHLRPRA